MAVTRERFNMGMTYEAFKAGRQNRAAFEGTEKLISLTEADLAPFRELPAALDVLVIVTETCPDVIMNVPILAAIAEKTGKLNPRIFMRDDNKDLMAQYMNGPYESVPVFAFFDQSWKELGVFIERPRAVTEMRDQKTREIYETRPELGPYGSQPSDLPEELRGQLQAAIRQMRADTQPEYARTSIRALGEMVREMTEGSGLPLRRGNLAAVAA